MLRLAVLASSVIAVTSAAQPLTTEAEKSDFRRTGRYAEVERLCPAFARRDPKHVRCFEMGRTPEGRPMLALALSSDGTLEAKAARAKGRPVILVQGGIHSGEIEGKDAGFMILRELLADKVAKGALAATTLVFVPVFNVDGHERFGPNNRPNQRGPEEMGFRTTAQNLNLNRDYMKVEAPEMAAMLALMAEWDPVVLVDLHTTDGAQFEHDVAVLVSPHTPRPDGLNKIAGALSEAIQARLTEMGHLPLPFYPSFRKDDDPTSGFAAGDASPRFSQIYAATRNRLGILVETHSWRPYKHRVQTTRDVLAAIFERTVADAAAWRAAADAADRAAPKLAGTQVALTFESTGEPRTIDFRGYAYEIKPSEVTGAPIISYDEHRPQIWKVPLYQQLKPELTVRAPRGGYIIPVAHAGWVAAKLRAHGIVYRALPNAKSSLRGESYRLREIKYQPPFEGRTQAKVSGAWAPDARPVPAGSLFVPIDQPRALLVLHLLEPEAPDSLLSWGYFNGMFEQKEYIEAYVLEPDARKMLARDAKTKAEFERRLKDDPAFAASPAARLRFFYERHPTYDDRMTLYPVMRVDVTL